MKLRNAHLAAVDRGNVLDYLVNEAHLDDGGKAPFFASVGFSREDPEYLVKARRDVAEYAEIVSSGESVHVRSIPRLSARACMHLMAHKARASDYYRLLTS